MALGISRSVVIAEEVHELQRAVAVCGDEIANLVGVGVDAPEAVLLQRSDELGDLDLASWWHPGSPSQCVGAPMVPILAVAGWRHMPAGQRHGGPCRSEGDPRQTLYGWTKGAAVRLQCESARGQRDWAWFRGEGCDFQIGNGPHPLGEDET